MNRKKQFAALLALLTFLVSCVDPVRLYASPISAPVKIFSEESQAKKIPKEISEIRIPEELGKIEEVYRAAGNKTIVILQDAHAIPDAQRSIEQLVEFFQSQYGIQLTGAEGADSELDAQFLKSFPDQKKLRETMNEYFERGELSGVSAAAIFEKFKGVYRGIEDWALYEKGLELYRQAFGKKESMLAQLSAESLKLEAEKSKIYSAKLLEVDSALRQFGRDQLDLIKMLEKFAAVNPPSHESEISILLAESRKHPAQESIDLEVKKFADEIRGKLRGAQPSVLKELNAKAQAFQTGQMTAQAYALFLRDTAVSQNIRLSLQFSKNLGQGVANQRRMRDIEGTKLFRDIEKYAREVKAGLFENDAQRDLDRKSREIYLLEKMAKLELTREEWEEIKKVEGGRWRVEVKHNFGSLPASTLDLRAYVEFYENAEARDKALSKNLFKQMALEKTDCAVMVAGGFHARGLTEHFKKEGVSFLLVLPRMKNLPEASHYEDQMRGIVSWKSYFEAENGRISVYKAFVRYMRDQLLQADRISYIGDRKNIDIRNTIYDGQILKNWRDQIIRDLSSQNRIEQASNYTRFLDELAQKSVKASNAAKIKKMERFFSSLRKLESEGKISKDSIYQLLRTSQVAPGAVSTVLAKSELRADLLRSEVTIVSAQISLPSAQPAQLTLESILKLNPETSIKVTSPYGSHQRQLRAEPYLIDEGKTLALPTAGSFGYGEMFIPIDQLNQPNGYKIETFSNQAPARSEVRTGDAEPNPYSVSETQETKLTDDGWEEFWLNHEAELWDYLKAGMETRFYSGMPAEEYRTEMAQLINAWIFKNYDQGREGVAPRVFNPSQNIFRSAFLTRKELYEGLGVNVQELTTSVSEIQNGREVVTASIFQRKDLSAAEIEIVLNEIKKLTPLKSDEPKILQRTSTISNILKGIYDFGDNVVLPITYLLTAPAFFIFSVIFPRNQKAGFSERVFDAYRASLFNFTRLFSRSYERVTNQLRYGTDDEERDSARSEIRSGGIFKLSDLDAMTRIIRRMQEDPSQHLPKNIMTAESTERIFAYDPFGVLIFAAPIDSAYYKEVSFIELIRDLWPKWGDTKIKKARQMQDDLERTMKPFIDSLGIDLTRKNMQFIFEETKDEEGRAVFAFRFLPPGKPGPLIFSADIELVPDQERKLFRDAFEYWHPYFYVKTDADITGLDQAALADESLAKKMPAQKPSYYEAALLRINEISHLIRQQSKTSFVTPALLSKVEELLGKAADDFESALGGKPSYDLIAPKISELRTLQSHAGVFTKLLSEDYLKDNTSSRSEARAMKDGDAVKREYADQIRFLDREASRRTREFIASNLYSQTIRHPEIFEETSADQIIESINGYIRSLEMTARNVNDLWKQIAKELDEEDRLRKIDGYGFMSDSIYRILVDIESRLASQEKQGRSGERYGRKNTGVSLSDAQKKMVVGLLAQTYANGAMGYAAWRSRSEARAGTYNEKWAELIPSQEIKEQLAKEMEAVAALIPDAVESTMVKGSARNLRNPQLNFSDLNGVTLPMFAVRWIQVFEMLKGETPEDVFAPENLKKIDPLFEKKFPLFVSALHLVRNPPAEDEAALDEEESLEREAAPEPFVPKIFQPKEDAGDVLLSSDSSENITKIETQGLWDQVSLLVSEIKRIEKQVFDPGVAFTKELNSGWVSSKTGRKSKAVDPESSLGHGLGHGAANGIGIPAMKFENSEAELKYRDLRIFQNDLAQVYQMLDFLRRQSSEDLKNVPAIQKQLFKLMSQGDAQIWSERLLGGVLKALKDGEVGSPEQEDIEIILEKIFRLLIKTRSELDQIQTRVHPKQILKMTDFSKIEKARSETRTGDYRPILMREFMDLFVKKGMLTENERLIIDVRHEWRGGIDADDLVRMTGYSKTKITEIYNSAMVKLAPDFESGWTNGFLITEEAYSAFMEAIKAHGTKTVKRFYLKGNMPVEGPEAVARSRNGKRGSTGARHWKGRSEVRSASEMAIPYSGLDYLKRLNMDIASQEIRDVINNLLRQKLDNKDILGAYLKYFEDRVPENKNPYFMQRGPILLKFLEDSGEIGIALDPEILAVRKGEIDRGIREYWEGLASIIVREAWGTELIRVLKDSPLMANQKKRADAIRAVGLASKKDKAFSIELDTPEFSAFLNQYKTDFLESVAFALAAEVYEAKKRWEFLSRLKRQSPNYIIRDKIAHLVLKNDGEVDLENLIRGEYQLEFYEIAKALSHGIPIRLEQEIILYYFLSLGLDQGLMDRINLMQDESMRNSLVPPFKPTDELLNKIKNYIHQFDEMIGPKRSELRTQSGPDFSALKRMMMNALRAEDSGDVRMLVNIYFESVERVFPDPRDTRAILEGFQNGLADILSRFRDPQSAKAEAVIKLIISYRSLLLTRSTKRHDPEFVKHFFNEVLKRWDETRDSAESGIYEDNGRVLFNTALHSLLFTDPQGDWADVPGWKELPSLLSKKIIYFNGKEYPRRGVYLADDIPESTGSLWQGKFSPGKNPIFQIGLVDSETNEVKPLLIKLGVREPMFEPITRGIQKLFELPGIEVDVYGGKILMMNYVEASPVYSNEFQINGLKSEFYLGGQAPSEILSDTALRDLGGQMAMLYLLGSRDAGMKQFLLMNDGSRILSIDHEFLFSDDLGAYQSFLGAMDPRSDFWMLAGYLSSGQLQILSDGFNRIMESVKTNRNNVQSRILELLKSAKLPAEYNPEVLVRNIQVRSQITYEQIAARSESRMISLLQNQYGLTDIKINRITKDGKDNLWAIESKQGKFILKQPKYRNKPVWIDWEASVLKKLGRQNAAQIRKTSDDKNYAQQDGLTFVLYQAVEGEELDWGGVEGVKLEKAAQWLAGMHKNLETFVPAGRDYLPEERPQVIGVIHHDIGLRKIETLKTKIEERGPPSLVEKEFLDKYPYIALQIKNLKERLTPELLARLPVSITHGDFHQGNGRFQPNGEFKAFDFENASREARIRDLANPFELRFSADKPRDGASLAFDKIETFVKAYHAVNPLTEDEIDLLPDIFRLAALEGVLFFASLFGKNERFLPVLKEQIENLRLIDSLNWRKLQKDLRSTAAARSESRSQEVTSLGIVLSGLFNKKIPEYFKKTIVRLNYFGSEISDIRTIENLPLHYVFGNADQWEYVLWEILKNAYDAQIDKSQRVIDLRVEGMPDGKLSVTVSNPGEVDRNNLIETAIRENVYVTREDSNFLVNYFATESKMADFLGFDYAEDVLQSSQVRRVSEDEIRNMPVHQLMMIDGLTTKSGQSKFLGGQGVGLKISKRTAEWNFKDDLRIFSENGKTEIEIIVPSPAQSDLELAMKGWVKSLLTGITPDRNKLDAAKLLSSLGTEKLVQVEPDFYDRWREYKSVYRYDGIIPAIEDILKLKPTEESGESKPAARAELRAVTDRMPAFELLKALQIDELQKRAETVDSKGDYQIYRNIPIRDREDPDLPPKTGEEILMNELIRLQGEAPPDEATVDFIFNPEGHLIAIFPSQETVRTLVNKTRIQRMSYLDLASYYVELPDFGSPEAVRVWADYAQREARDHTFIENLIRDEHTKKSGAGTRFLVGRYLGIEAKPYVYAEISPEGKISKLEEFTPAQFKSEYTVKKEGFRQIIIPIYPTVYSPAQSVHLGADQKYYEGILQLPIQEGDPVLVGFGGSGFDTLLAYYAMLKTSGKEKIDNALFNYFDLNPLGDANVRTVARLAGFKVDARVNDNLVDSSGNPLFGTKQFRFVLANMPLTSFSFTPAYRLPLTRYWDGDNYFTLKKFSENLDRVMTADGLAHIWQGYHIREGRNAIADMLEYAGNYDFRIWGPAENAPSVFNVSVQQEKYLSAADYRSLGIYTVTKKTAARSEARSVSQGLPRLKKQNDLDPRVGVKVGEDVFFLPSLLDNAMEASLVALSRYQNTQIALREIEKDAAAFFNPNALGASAVVRKSGLESKKEAKLILDVMGSLLKAYPEKYKTEKNRALIQLMKSDEAMLLTDIEKIVRVIPRIEIKFYKVRKEATSGTMRTEILAWYLGHERFQTELELSDDESLALYRIKDGLFWEMWAILLLEQSGIWLTALGVYLQEHYPRMPASELWTQIYFSGFTGMAVSVAPAPLIRKRVQKELQQAFEKAEVKHDWSRLDKLEKSVTGKVHRDLELILDAGLGDYFGFTREDLDNYRRSEVRDNKTIIDYLETNVKRMELSALGPKFDAKTTVDEQGNQIGIFGPTRFSILDDGAQRILLNSEDKLLEVGGVRASIYAAGIKGVRAESYELSKPHYDLSVKIRDGLAAFNTQTPDDLKHRDIEAIKIHNENVFKVLNDPEAMKKYSVIYYFGLSSFDQDKIDEALAKNMSKDAIVWVFDLYPTDDDNGVRFKDLQEVTTDYTKVKNSRHRVFIRKDADPKQIKELRQTAKISADISSFLNALRRGSQILTRTPLERELKEEFSFRSLFAHGIGNLIYVMKNYKFGGDPVKGLEEVQKSIDLIVLMLEELLKQPLNTPYTSEYIPEIMPVPPLWEIYSGIQSSIRKKEFLPEHVEQIRAIHQFFSDIQKRSNVIIKNSAGRSEVRTVKREESVKTQLSDEEAQFNRLVEAGIQRIGFTNFIMPKDSPLSLYLQGQLNRIVREVPAEIYVIEDHEENAFATPGGKIFVTTGMLAMLETEEELLALLMHELTHIEKKHTFLRRGLSDDLYVLGIIRLTELEADSAMMLEMDRRGLNPIGALSLTKKLREMTKKIYVGKNDRYRLIMRELDPEHGSATQRGTMLREFIRFYDFEYLSEKTTPLPWSSQKINQVSFREFSESELETLASRDPEFFWREFGRLLRDQPEEISSEILDAFLKNRAPWLPETERIAIAILIHANILNKKSPYVYRGKGHELKIEPSEFGDYFSAASVISLLKQNIFTAVGLKIKGKDLVFMASSAIQREIKQGHSAAHMDDITEMIRSIRDYQNEHFGADLVFDNWLAEAAIAAWISAEGVHGKAEYQVTRKTLITSGSASPNARIVTISEPLPFSSFNTELFRMFLKLNFQQGVSSANLIYRVLNELGMSIGSEPIYLESNSAAYFMEFKSELDKVLLVLMDHLLEISQGKSFFERLLIWGGVEHIVSYEELRKMKKIGKNLARIKDSKQTLTSLTDILAGAQGFEVILPSLARLARESGDMFSKGDYFEKIVEEAMMEPSNNGRQQKFKKLIDRFTVATYGLIGESDRPKAIIYDMALHLSNVNSKQSLLAHIESEFDACDFKSQNEKEELWRRIVAMVNARNKLFPQSPIILTDQDYYGIKRIKNDEKKRLLAKLRRTAAASAGDALSDVVEAVRKYHFAFNSVDAKVYDEAWIPISRILMKYLKSGKSKFPETSKDFEQVFALSLLAQESMSAGTLASVSFREMILRAESFEKAFEYLKQYSFVSRAILMEGVSLLVQSKAKSKDDLEIIQSWFMDHLKDFFDRPQDAMAMTVTHAIGNFIDEGERLDFFKRAISTNKTDEELKRHMAQKWWDVILSKKSLGLANIEEIALLGYYGELPGGNLSKLDMARAKVLDVLNKDENEGILPFNEFYTALFRLDSVVVYLLLQSLTLEGPDALFRSEKSKKELVRYFVQHYMQFERNETSERVLTDVTDTIASDLDPDDLFYFLGPALAQVALQVPESPFSDEPLVEGLLKPTFDALKVKYPGIEDPNKFPVTHELFKNQLLSYIRGVSPKLKKDRELSSGYFFPDITHVRIEDHLLERMSSLIPKRRILSKQVSPIELAVEVAKYAGSLTVRLLQLAGMYFDFSPEDRKVLSQVFDAMQGQNKFQAYQILKRESKKNQRVKIFFDSLKEIGQMLGGGSIVTVYQAENDRKEEFAVGVTNPNVGYRSWEVEQFGSRLLDGLIRRAEAQKAPEVKYYRLVKSLLSEAHEWVLKEINDPDYIRKNAAFAQGIDHRSEQPNRFRPVQKAARTQLVVPKVLDTGTDQIRIEELIKGSSFNKELNEIAEMKKSEEIGAIKEKVSIITQSYLYQLFEMGIVHSDIHPGQFISMKNNRLAVLDRKNLIVLAPEEMELILDLIADFVLGNADLAIQKLVARYAGQNEAKNTEIIAKVKAEILRRIGQSESPEEIFQAAVWALKEEGVKLPLNWLLVAKNFMALNKMSQMAGFHHLLEGLVYEPGVSSGEWTFEQLFGNAAEVMPRFTKKIVARIGANWVEKASNAARSELRAITPAGSSGPSDRGRIPPIQPIEKKRGREEGDAEEKLPKPAEDTVEISKEGEEAAKKNDAKSEIRSLAPALVDYLIKEKRLTPEQLQVWAEKGATVILSLGVGELEQIARDLALKELNQETDPPASLPQLRNPTASKAMSQIGSNFVKSYGPDFKFNFALAFHMPGKEAGLAEVLSAEVIKKHISLAFMSKDMKTIKVDGMNIQSVRIESVGLRKNNASDNPVVAIITDEDLAKKLYSFLVRRSGPELPDETFLNPVADFVEILAGAVVSQADGVDTSDDLKDENLRKKIKAELLSRLFGEGFVNPENPFDFDENGDLRVDRGILFKIVTQAFSEARAAVSA